MPPFTVKAPAAQPQGQRAAPKKPRSAAARVLLVEDDPVTAEVFARALQRAGHEVRIATDGNQALHALRDHPPDLVVLDMGLPTVPGTEVLRRLRAGGHGSLPVVVVSGAAPKPASGIDALVEPGCWLEKPIRPAQLVAVVDDFCAD